MRLSLPLIVLLVAAGPSFAQSLPNFATSAYCTSDAGGGSQLRTCVAADATGRAATASQTRTDLPYNPADDTRKARLRDGSDNDDVAVGLCPPLHRMTRYGCL